MKNIYGDSVHSKVSIHRIDVASKPEDSLRANAECRYTGGLLKRLVKVANELDRRLLFKEADMLDAIINPSDKGYYIADSDIHGEGVFASKDISKGDFIGIAIKVYSRDRIDKLFGIQEGVDFQRTDLGKKINHQTACNAKQVDDNDYVVFATKFIPKDSEITINYADKDMPWFIDKNINSYIEK